MTAPPLARLSLCSGGFFQWLYVDDGDKNAWIKIKRVMENPQRVFISLLFFCFVFSKHYSTHPTHPPYPFHFFPFRSSQQEARQVALTFFLPNRYVLSSGKYHIYSCWTDGISELVFLVRVSSPWCKCDMENSAVQAASCNKVLFVCKG